MCELTFINTHRADLNKLFIMNLALENTRTSNKHGWGIFSKKAGVFKTVLSPWNTAGFGSLIRDRISSDPSLLHVRDASRGTDIKLEFNHPFETEQLVLMHNGTLTQKTEDKTYAGKLDSEIFLLELTKKYLSLKKSEDRLIVSLQETMKEFTGKFAFLIYEKDPGIWYAVRGRTADLHMLYTLDPVDEKIILGYVINTEKDDLETGMNLSLETLGLVGKTDIPLPSVISELTAETIFRLDKLDIVPVGAIKQNTAVTPVVVTYGAGYGHGYGRNWNRGPAWEGEDDEDDPFGPFAQEVKSLKDWMDTYKLNVEDLDRIAVQSLGIPLLSFTEVDLLALKRHILPKLTCSKKFREEVLKKLKEHGSWWLSDVHKKYGFQYPYMLEPNKSLFLRALNDRIKELPQKV